MLYSKHVFCNNIRKSLRTYFLFLFFKDSIYLFQTEGKGGRKRGRDTSVCGCISKAPYWGPGLQPRHVPRPGIEPATPWFAGGCSTTEPQQSGLLGIFRLVLPYYQLSLCVLILVASLCLYVLVRSAMTPSLRGVALCSRCPVGPSGTLSFITCTGCSRNVPVRVM